MVEQLATQKLMQMLAKDITDKNASAGGSHPRRPLSLVNLDKGTSFECNGLLDSEATLGNERMAELGQQRSKLTVYSSRDAIFTMSPGSAR